MRYDTSSQLGKYSTLSSSCFNIQYYFDVFSFMCDFRANFPAFNKSIVVLYFLQQVNSLSAG